MGNFVFTVFAAVYVLMAQELPVKRIPGAKVDVVLLQDESGSMEETDPYGVRRLAADIVSENLSIAGEGNRAALVLFGTVVKKKVDLSRDFKAMREFARKGLEYIKPGERAYLTLETTPVRDYTDIFGALKMAYEVLSASPDRAVVGGREYGKEKLVILLTDGKVDPWPGNLDRYGEVARDYLEYIKDVPPAFRYRRGRIFLDKVAAIDKERIESEIVERFKRKGWRIYPIGFSENVDRQLLEDLAFGTYGVPGIAEDYRELAGILDEVIPKAENVIPLVVRNFCRTRRASGTVTLGRDIESALFKADFTKMLEEGAFIRPENLLLLLTDPQGRQIRSDREGLFTFNTDRKGRVLTVTYLQESPIPGTWRFEVRGIGRDICGKVEVAGRREQYPSIRLEPEQEEYWEGSEVEAIVSLLGEGVNLPIRKVEGKLRTPHREEIPLIFGPPDANNEARTKIKLNKGVGEYFLQVAITDEKYGSEVHKDRVIRVVPVEYCTPLVEPERIDLGAIGDRRLEATYEGIEVDIGDYPKPVEVKVKKPLLEKGVKAIPVHWIKIRPQGGVASRGNPFRFNIEVGLPQDIPPDLKDGIYRGVISIESESFREPVRVPVELELKFPRIIIKGSSELRKLVFDFSLMLGKPKERTIKVGTTSLVDRELTLSISPNVKSPEGLNEERIEISFPGEHPLEVKILAKAGRLSNVKLVAKLLERRLEPEFRIPAGTYTGELRVRGPLMREVRLPIEVKVPERPFILVLRKVFLMLCIFPIIGILVNFRKVKKLKGLFEDILDITGSPHSLVGFTVSRTGQGWTLVSDTAGVRVNDRPASRGTRIGLNPRDRIEVGDRGNIREYYRYRVRRVSKDLLSLNLERSPYGSKGSYCFKRFFVPMVALVFLVFGAVWAWTNI